MAGGSLDEAIEWVKRIPNRPGVEAVIEIRPVGELEDWGDIVTPEVRESEERVRAELDARKRAEGAEQG